MEEKELSEQQKQELRKHAASLLGKKGGKAGSGEAKRRDHQHYAIELVEARRAARTRRQLLGE